MVFRRDLWVVFSDWTLNVEFMRVELFLGQLQVINWVQYLQTQIIETRSYSHGAIPIKSNSNSAAEIMV